MSDGLSDAYRMEQDARARERRADADTRFEESFSFDMRVNAAINAINRYDHQRNVYLDVDDYTAARDPDRRSREFDRLCGDHLRLRDSLRALLDTLDKGKF